MKILFTYSVPSGGVEVMNRLRCQALRMLGIEGHLLYQFNGAGRQNITDIPLFITNLDEELRGVLQSNHYDAIVTVCDHMMLERLRGLGYNGPLIYESQGFGSHEQGRSVLASAQMFIRRYACGAITNSTAHLMDLFNTYLHDFPRFYVQNIVDTEGTMHYQSAPWLNPSGQPVLAWIGRIERNKNWRLFLEIGQVLSGRYPHLQLWLFEDANIYEVDERNEFYKMVQRNELGNRLTVHSNIPHSHMPHYLSAVGDSGGMLISTSIVESFGYAAAEALSCRCPVLSTDSGGVRNSIIHNVTGKFFSGSLENAVQEAAELIENIRLRESIQIQGENYIRVTFSPGRYLADFNNILIALGIRAPSLHGL